MGEASAAKVFGTELTQQVARQLLEVLDHNGLRRGADAPLRGACEAAYRFAVINTFGGGANEIQRDIIAMAGLGMPRAPRDVRASHNGRDKEDRVSDRTQTPRFTPSCVRSSASPPAAPESLRWHRIRSTSR